MPSGNVADTLTNVHAAASVTSIAADRRTLTVGTITAQGGVPGERGEAYLVTLEDGWFPCVVTRAVGTTIILAAPLPRAINLGSAASLQFAWWSATLASTDITSAARRNIPWQVTYTRQDGAALPTELLVDEGMLHVVRSPFDTGLTHALLVRLRPSLVNSVRKTENDLSVYVDAAAEELGQKVDQRMHERGLTRDDVPAAERLQLAHAYYAHAMILEEPPMSDPSSMRATVMEGAKQIRARADELFELAMRSIWIDVNRDGVVDTGEPESVAAGPDRLDVGAYFNGRSTTDLTQAERVFSKWMKR